MMTNQLAGGQTIRFATLGPIPGKGFGLGGAVTFAPTPFDPPNSKGEFQWGGARRHALVDLPGGQHGRRADGPARDGLLESVLLRVQASRL